MKIGRLVLGRKPGQSIKVGNDVLVTITSCRGGLVRVAIEAPINVKVLRSELDTYSAKRAVLENHRQNEPKNSRKYGIKTLI